MYYIITIDARSSRKNGQMMVAESWGKEEREKEFENAKGIKSRER
jgi:hypothetical protein